jgi:ParB family transcriptional regulator, chromosome partitioning protein
MQIGVDLIDEDPQQPRTLFDEDAMAELAASITERGVLQPISVRAHPETPGRWMLNFGARRLRACRLASRERIPSFVDESADDYAQVIENEQRERLKPLELALFVQRRMASGDSQAEIARRLGKSRAYMTSVCAMIDPPDWLMNVYRQGRCGGITALYDLRRLHEREPDVVSEWLANRHFVSREDLAALKLQLAADASAPERTSGATSTTEPCSEPSVRAATVQVPRVNVAASRSSKKRSSAGVLQLHGCVDGVRVEVVCNRLPAQRTEVFVRSETGVVGVAALTKVRDLELRREE